MSAVVPSPTPVKLSTSGKKEKSRHWTDYVLVLSILVGAAFFFISPPSGINPKGWHLIGLLIPLIVVWATASMPSGIGGAVFLSLVVGFQLVTPAVAFQGFTTQLPWLMAGAFAIGTAMEQTGFSKRMAYWLMSRLKGVWGLIGAAYATNIFLIGVPSSNARAAILAPVLNSIMSSIGRPVESNLSRLLVYNFVNATVNLLSVLLLTGGAANVLAVGMYTQMTGRSVGWTEWLIVMLMPTLIIIGTTFAASALLSRPEPELVAKLRNSDAAKQAYEALGPMTLNEWKVVGFFIIAVFLWVFSGSIHWDLGFSALFIAGLLFLPDFGVLKPRSVRDINWDVVLMVGVAVSVAGILDATGMTKVVSDALVGPLLNPLSAYGLAGIAAGTIIVGLIAHFLLPAPANLALALPLLIGWGTKTMNLPPDVVLVFMVLLSATGNLIVAVAYQMPPYFVYLGMDLTEPRAFNGLLLKVYPFAAVALFVSAFVGYWVLKLFGLSA